MVKSLPLKLWLNATTSSGIPDPMIARPKIHAYSNCEKAVITWMVGEKLLDGLDVFQVPDQLGFDLGVIFRSVRVAAFRDTDALLYIKMNKNYVFFFAFNRTCSKAMKNGSTNDSIQSIEIALFKMRSTTISTMIKITKQRQNQKIKALKCLAFILYLRKTEH